MTLNLQHVFLLGILTSTLHWFLARAEIARPLWSNAKGAMDKLLRCPSCSGFWLGLVYGLSGVTPVEGLPRYSTVIMAGIFGMFFTPIFETVLLWALRASAVETDLETETPPVVLPLADIEQRVVTVLTDYFVDAPAEMRADVAHEIMHAFVDLVVPPEPEEPPTAN